MALYAVAERARPSRRRFSRLTVGADVERRLALTSAKKPRSSDSIRAACSFLVFMKPKASDASPRPVRPGVGAQADQQPDRALGGANRQQFEAGHAQAGSGRHEWLFVGV